MTSRQPERCCRRSPYRLAPGFCLASSRYYTLPIDWLRDSAWLPLDIILFLSTGFGILPGFLSILYSSYRLAPGFCLASSRYYTLPIDWLRDSAWLPLDIILSLSTGSGILPGFLSILYSPYRLAPGFCLASSRYYTLPIDWLRDSAWLPLDIILSLSTGSGILPGFLSILYSPYRLAPGFCLASSRYYTLPIDWLRDSAGVPLDIILSLSTGSGILPGFLSILYSPYRLAPGFCLGSSRYYNVLAFG